MEATFVLACSVEPGNSNRVMSVDATQSDMARFIASGDEEALRAIIGAHADLVYSACLRVLNDPQLADDAGQAVFIVFTSKAKSIRSGTPLAPWFYRTAVFVAQRMKRDRANRRRYEQEAAAMRVHEQSGNVEQQQQWETLRPQLDALLAALPAAEREALVLRYLAGKSEPEAARELGCPVGTLSARVSRAIARLRQRLSGNADTVLSTAALATLLETQATTKAPAQFAVSIHAACLGKAGASTTAKVIAEETMRALFWMKLKVVAAVLMISAAVGVPVSIRLAAGETAPQKPPAVAPAAPAPAIPTTVNFTPHALKERLIYEQTVRTEAKIESPIASLIQGMIPDNLLDCAIFELKLDDPKAAKQAEIQCLKCFCVAKMPVTKDGKKTEMILTGASGTQTAKLPSCRIAIAADGKLTPSGAKENSSNEFTIITSGAHATIEKNGANLGFLLMGDFALAPLMSTLGHPRAVNDRWTIQSSLGGTESIAAEYFLKKIHSQNGRILATLECKRVSVSLPATLVPDEQVHIANADINLKPKALTGELSDELVVDVEKGVVIQQKRIVNAKVVYALALPDSIPEFVRKAAGDELTMTGKFTMDCLLIDEAQSGVIARLGDNQEALKAVRERWGKRTSDSDPLMKELATSLLETSPKQLPPKAKAEEF
jgi:RNA polymerase sigma factor (sigma-70 family)